MLNTLELKNEFFFFDCNIIYRETNEMCVCVCACWCQLYVFMFNFVVYRVRVLLQKNVFLFFVVSGGVRLNRFCVLNG
jgi:hypothetical protein